MASLMPAHWGAMANLVEKLGLPAMQSGGSSASITLMLNEAVASNKFVSEVSGPKQRARAALLFKSFEGFLDALTATPEWRDFMTLYRRAGSVAGADWMTQLQKFLDQASAMSGPKLQQYILENGELLKAIIAKVCASALSQKQTTLASAPRSTEFLRVIYHWSSKMCSTPAFMQKNFVRRSESSARSMLSLTPTCSFGRD